MNRPRNNRIARLFIVATLVTVLSVISYSLSVSYAFVNPWLTAPLGNVSSTIHTGAASQTKLGSLNLLGGLCISGDCKIAWSQVGLTQWTTTGFNLSYTGGNVGVGTTDPASTLSIIGELKTTSGGVRYPDNTLQATAWWSGSTLPASRVTANPFYMGNYGFPSSLGMNTSTANNLPQTLSVYGSAYVSSSVGIGTPSPGSKLTVAGTIESTTGGFKFPDGTVQMTAAGQGSQWTTGGSNVYFMGGNVGIADTNPTSTLSVAGEIKTTAGGVRYPDNSVQVTAWNLSSAISSSRVTAGVFNASTYSFPSSLGVTTTTVNGLPQPLSVYGGGYVSGSLGVGTTTLSSKLTVAGVIESTPGSGGFKFPNGSVQATAAGAPSPWTTAGLNIYFTRGNVGIASTNPTSTLSVAGEITTTAGGVRFPDATLQSIAWNTASMIPASNVTAGIFASGNFSFPSSLGIGTASTAVPQPLSVYGNGYIAGSLGINITPPLEVLHVATNPANSTRILVDNRLGTASKNASLAFAKNGTANWTVGSDFVGSNGTDIFSVYGGATPSHKLVIDTNGNVGISTTAPGSNLDVKGTLRINGSSSGFIGLAPAANAGSAIYTWPATDGTNGQALGTNGAGGLTWSTPASVWIRVGNDIYYNGGNVGIGVNDPQARLHVAGGDVMLDGKGASSSGFTQIAPDWLPAIASLAVYNGKLYAGRAGSGPNVFRYDGGTTWTNVGAIGAGTVTSLAVHGGNLYAAATAGGDKVYRYDGGTTWADVTVNPAGFSGSPRQLQVYNGQLYVADGWGNVYRYDGSGVWTNVGSPGTPNAVMTFAVNNGQMYVGSSGGGVYRYDGGTAWTNIRTGVSGAVFALASYNSSLYASDSTFVYRYDGGTTWTMAQILGDISTEKRALAVYNGRLYAGGTGATGPSPACTNSLYRYDGGTSWSTFTYRWNCNYPAIGVMAVYNDSLILGENGTVHTYVENTEQSYALKFKSESETASVRFRTGSSGQGNTGQPQHGQFLFSHGLITNSGAYDVAEKYRAVGETITPGDVVSVAKASPDSIEKTSGAYQETAVGVVSTKPGFVLTGEGGGNAGTEVAITGRTPVKVSAANGPIDIGDPITSSPYPGIGMKATSPGKVIGYALEAFRADDPRKVRGEIQAFIAPGWYAP